MCPRSIEACFQGIILYYIPDMAGVKTAKIQQSRGFCGSAIPSNDFFLSLQILHARHEILPDLLHFLGKTIICSNFIHSSIILLFKGFPDAVIRPDMASSGPYEYPQGASMGLDPFYIKNIEAVPAEEIA